MRRLAIVLLTSVALFATPSVALASHVPAGARADDPSITSNAALQADMADGLVEFVKVDFAWGSDDQVNVPAGQHVVFHRVTFRNSGGGHTVEVKNGSSALLDRVRFRAAPSEDHFQSQGNGVSEVRDSVFESSPGEDHVDTKSGGQVTVGWNHFTASTPHGRTIQNHNGTGRVQLLDNTEVSNVFYESGATGDIARNTIAQLDLYDAENVLVEGNQLGNIKLGPSDGSRPPIDTYFLNNTITGSVQNGLNGNDCYRNGNTAGKLGFCLVGPPAWYGG